jgi:hypothetical protein
MGLLTMSLSLDKELVSVAISVFREALAAAVNLAHHFPTLPCLGASTWTRSYFARLPFTAVGNRNPIQHLVLLQGMHIS